MGVPSSDRASWSKRERSLSLLLDGAEGPETDVRDEIERSWRRCLRFGVSIADEELPYDPDLDDQSRLRRAADPVIEQFAEQLAHVPVTILLADRNARIVDRRVGSAQLRSALDSSQVAPGFFFAEENSGTNGVGTALEERRLFEVRGGEHYRESLQNLVCVAAPIVHPIGYGIEGALDITCSLADASDLMGTLLTAAVREIEARLYEESTVRERALLQSFLRLSRRANAAVVTMSHGMMMANPAAAQLLDPSDHAVLWDWVARHLDHRDEHVGELRLAGETAMQVRARRVTAAADPLGVTIELRPVTSTEGSGRQRRQPVGRSEVIGEELAGRSIGAARVRTQLDTLATTTGAVLITGEHGVGKTHAAVYLARGRDHSSDVLTVNATSEHVGRDDWLDELRRHLRYGGTVIVRCIDQIPGELIGGFEALVEESSAHDRALIATATETTPGAMQPRAHFVHRVWIPPLRHRSEDITDLAHALLSRHSPSGAVPRLLPAALQCLTAYDWPANVRELEATLAAAVVQSRHGDIAVEHLPDTIRNRGPVSHLPALKRVEREAIIRALRMTDGNKAATAARLGIARSTLYRKLRAFGLEADRFPDWSNPS